MNRVWSRLAGAGAALGAGALAAVAHPPFGIWPGFFGYALLFWLVDRLEGPGRLRRAFATGWAAGFAYFLIGCWWVAQAFLVDAEHQAWMAPFAAVLLPAGLGLFWGAACALYRKLAPAHLGRVFVFAAVFSLFEWLRGHVLTGFPWNLPGETWAAGSAPSQAASWLGAYGLTFVTVFALAALAPLFQPGERKRRTGMAALGVLAVAGLWIAGELRLAHARVHETTTFIRVVQPDVPQESKWTEAAFRGIVLRYVNLTGRQGSHYPDVVIWPEGALPAAADDVLAPDSWVGPAIARAMAPGQTLLMGSYRAQPSNKGPARYYNSLYALQKTSDGRLRVTGVYDKHRLVPFGEYLPLEPLMTRLGLKDLAHVGDGFSSGPRPKPLPLAGLPTVQPLICYESLFPGLAADGPGRPAWIVNVSNDAWFGPTSGPRQHLNLAGYRAIEQGLPIVRATPTGVSAVVDPYGRIRREQRLEPGESGVIDAALPAPAPPTFYSRFGDLLFWLLMVFGLGCAVWGRTVRVKLW